MPGFSKPLSHISDLRRASRTRTFVYGICGDRQVERVNLSVRFLKKFSRSDIVIVASRTSLPIEHEQVVDVPAGDTLNDHQIALLLKTNIHRLVADRTILGCYLDTDVIATSEEVDSVFDYACGPFAFASDHVDLPTFSSWAIACGCRERCQHLTRAIRNTFRVDVDPNWRHWNGGVFVFSEEAAPLLDCWNEFTRHIIADTLWQTADQGTLIAAAWKMGVQNATILPRKFNFIVDCFYGMSLKKRAEARACDLPYDDSYEVGV